MTSDSRSLLRKRLPGEPRAQSEAVAELREYEARVRKNVGHALAPFYVPRPESVFRWRVELSCGCVVEEWTRGPDRFPDDIQEQDPLVQGRHTLPRGERRCRDTERHESAVDRPPYREIVEWIDRDLIEHPPDPEHDPGGTIDDALWAVIRRRTAKTSAHWTVRLACGHYSRGPVTDPAWKPEDGPTLSTIKRQREMLQELDEWDATEPAESEDDAVERAHMREMIELRWPRPQPVRQCFWCPRAVNITGYARIGWLAEKPQPPQPPRSQREVLEERLERMKADQAKLEARLQKLADSDRD